MVLFKILGIIEVNFQTVLSFLLGIVIGAILVFVIYLLLVVLSLRDKKFFVKTDEDTLTEAMAKDMIIEAQKAFKDKELRGKETKFNYFRHIVSDLTYGIASSFFPNSKYPLLELSVDETIELLGYVQKRIDEILDKGALKAIRRLKISTIFNVSQTTATAMNSKAFKISQNAVKKVTTIGKIWSYVNPANLIKKPFSKAIEVIMNRVYLASITIVGEEAFKIYSKSVLKEEVSIETSLKELIEPDEELKNALAEDFKVKNDDTNQVLDASSNKPGKFKTRALTSFSDVSYDKSPDKARKMKEVNVTESVEDTSNV
ncbi:MAG: hypothetical protein K6A63_06880 [Acholeplasmatales bacterium]|nr:hypothetical protein [Acholeplasmatales bacterium]